MLVSIIVPVFKVESFLERCIKSVVDQTYTNLEIILVDDGSPDNCPQMCDVWEKKDSRIRVIHKPNGGLSSARNAGLKIAKGKYVYFLDSDDYIITDCIEKMVRVLEHDSFPQMVMGSIMPDPKEDSSLLYYDLSYRNIPDKYENNVSIRKKFFDAKTSIPVNGVNKLINRDFLIDNDFFFKEGIIHEDEHWAFFIYRKLERISFLFEFTYIHPVNPESITNTSTLRNTSNYMSIIFKDFLDNLDNVEFYAQLKYCIDRFFEYYIISYKEDSYKRLLRQFWRIVLDKKRFDCFYLLLLFYKKLFGFMALNYLCKIKNIIC